VVPQFRNIKKNTGELMARRKLVQAAVCLLSLLFLFGCSHLSKSQPKPPEPPKEFAAMIVKKDELAALPTTEKLSKKPAIKGKIAIVSNHDGAITVDRFSEDGANFWTDAPIPGETYNSFLPVELYAKNPDEIETLIKINCVSKKDEALYTNSNSSKDEMMIYEYVICDVGVIDYKTATLIAKKQAGKNVPPRVINNRTIAKTPWLEICEFLRSLPTGDKTSSL
jgi:hypothetical protein